MAYAKSAEKVIGFRKGKKDKPWIRENTRLIRDYRENVKDVKEISNNTGLEMAEAENINDKEKMRCN